MAQKNQEIVFSFNNALKQMQLPTSLNSFENGELLMLHLLQNISKLPNIVFVDLNMPRKNGSECLSEIKNNQDLANIPVIIYSTALDEKIADSFYASGAHYYLLKRNFDELKTTLFEIISHLIENKFQKLGRDNFVFNKKAE